MQRCRGEERERKRDQGDCFHAERSRNDQARVGYVQRSPFPEAVATVDDERDDDEERYQRDEEDADSRPIQWPAHER